MLLRTSLHNVLTTYASTHPFGSGPKSAESPAQLILQSQQFLELLKMSTVYHHVNVRIVFCFFKTKLFCEVNFKNTSQFARIAHVLPMVLMVRCVQVSHLVMPQELLLPERNPKAKQGTQRKDGACLGAPTMLRNPHCWPLLHGSWHSNAQPFAEMKRWMQRCN